jgi:cyanophycin synthetase
LERNRRFSNGELGWRQSRLPPSHFAEQLVNRLKTFRTDADNPGRNNLYRVGKGYALVDYGHNPDGFAAICRMVSKWEGKTITGIINIAGDRDDRIVRDAAKIAAGCFQRVIATEDLDRRGRAEGEIPRAAQRSGQTGKSRLSLRNNAE